MFVFDDDSEAARLVEEGLLAELYGDVEPEEAGARCRYCGRAGLIWNHTECGWRLYNKRGPHVCKAYEKKGTTT